MGFSTMGSTYQEVKQKYGKIASTEPKEIPFRNQKLFSSQISNK